MRDRRPGPEARHAGDRAEGREGACEFQAGDGRPRGHQREHYRHQRRAQAPAGDARQAQHAARGAGALHRTIAVERNYRYDTADQLVSAGGLQYRYDPVGRLLEAGLSGQLDERFDFDPAGNILAPPAKLVSHQDLPKVLDNLLKEYAGTHYTWDERGNLTERQHNGKKTGFEWDAFNRMVGATTEQGTTRYTYDPLGRRIAKRTEMFDSVPLPFEPAPAITSEETLYGWDGDTLAFESSRGGERDGRRNEQEAYTVHYVHEAGSFVPLLQAREANAVRLNPTTDVKALKAANFGEYDIRKDPMWNGDGDLQATPFRPFDINFYQCDHLGTPKELTDHEGKVAWKASYKAWGQAKEVISEAAKRAGVTQPIRFQGQYLDEETGLHYNRHRYYDPQAGRFVSQDPVGLLGGANLQQYAPNPVEWVDPLGLTKSGVATICRYNSDSPSGHYTVIVENEGKDLHTHQVITDDAGSTTVVNEARSKVMAPDTPSSTAKVHLPDAEATQNFQKSQVGKPLGQYNERTNSCVDHVANVLRAGGENVPPVQAVK